MTITFSTHPGTLERQQQRKYQNFLFSDSARITAATVEHAQQQDKLARAKFIDDFQQLVAEIVGLETTVESQHILDLKTRLDRSMVECASLPGDLSELRTAIRKLTLPIMHAIQQGTAGDPAGMAKLTEEDEARSLHFSMLENPLIADILNSSSVIQADELTATLLSSDPEQLSQALLIFSPGQLEQLLEDAARLIHQAEAAGENTAMTHKQFALIKTANQQSSQSS